MQPVVILGGFLSSPAAYKGLCQGLRALTGRPVTIARVQVHDWPLTVSTFGWARLLDKLDTVVRSAAKESATGRVTLVGHSVGGVLARLYLSPERFLGRTYAGLRWVDHLITLGSPHHNRGGWRRGGRLSRWVEARYPGAWFAPQVRYTCVAGRWLQGDRAGTGLQRWAFDVYREIGGDGNVWGDGLIPVEAAWLDGALAVLLEGTSHFSILGTPWYGSQETIRLWWQVEGGDDAQKSQQPSDRGYRRVDTAAPE